jgi:hypothetical protein
VGRVEVKRGSVASPKRGSSRSGAGPTDGPRATDDGLETHTYRDVRALPHEPDPDKRPSDVGTGGRWAMLPSQRGERLVQNVGAVTGGGRSKSCGWLSAHTNFDAQAVFRWGG